MEREKGQGFSSVAKRSLKPSWNRTEMIPALRVSGTFQLQWHSQVLLVEKVADLSSLFSFHERVFVSFRLVPGLSMMCEAVGKHSVNGTRLVELG